MDRALGPSTQTFSLRMAPDPSCLPEMREQVSQLGLRPRTAEDLRLLVSELVTNSIRHARFESGDQIEVRVWLDQREITVEVEDPGPGFDPALSKGGPGRRPNRWGLYLVDRLASSWGVDTKSGCRVWFVLPTDGRV